jgi:hypothetical protein
MPHCCLITSTNYFAATGYLRCLLIFLEVQFAASTTESLFQANFVCQPNLSSQNQAKPVAYRFSLLSQSWQVE